jgi:hypothetical protein
MDSDVIMLRPVPFQGEHFFNLKWRGDVGHFICGNVIYAKPHSRHLGKLYEMSITRFFDGHGRAFGKWGPSSCPTTSPRPTATNYKNSCFSPVLFNPIDWTEVDHFDRPVAQLADYLNDERMFGVHPWNARVYGFRGRRPPANLLRPEG